MTHAVFFDPDMQERIVSTTRSTVSLAATYSTFDDDDDDEVLDGGDCLFTLSREFFANVMNEWFDALAPLCTNGAYSRGGSLMFTDVRKRPDGATLLAHLVDVPPDGVEYGSAAYIAYASREIPVPEFVATRRTELHVDARAATAAEVAAEPVRGSAALRDAALEEALAEMVRTPEHCACSS